MPPAEPLLGTEQVPARQRSERRARERCLVRPLGNHEHGLVLILVLIVLGGGVQKQASGSGRDSFSPEFAAQEIGQFPLLPRHVPRAAGGPAFTPDPASHQ